jgi:hypothetical protein
MLQRAEAGRGRREASHVSADAIKKSVDIT